MKRAQTPAPVLLNVHAVPVVQLLMQEYHAKTMAMKDAERRLHEAAAACAKAQGLKPEDFDLNWDLKAFVPKKRD